MPASVDPKLILVGVSPGNSPNAVDTRRCYSEPRVEKDKDSHFYYRDSSGYWDKLRYLTSAFFMGLSELEAVSLCSHFNLATASSGDAAGVRAERDIVAWVSSLLNAVHKPDLIVFFGLVGKFQTNEGG